MSTSSLLYAKCPLEIHCSPTQASRLCNTLLRAVSTPLIPASCRCRHCAGSTKARVTASMLEPDRWMGLGRCAAVHAGPRPTTLREDIFPGHPQYFAVRRGRRLHLHEARRHVGDRTGTTARGVDVPLRPEWRGRVSAWSRSDRLVATHDRGAMGCRGPNRRRHGRGQPRRIAVAVRAPLERARRRAALDPSARGRGRFAPDARRAPVDRPPRRRPAARDPRRNDRCGLDADRSALGARRHRQPGAIGHLVDCVRGAGRVPHRGRDGLDRRTRALVAGVLRRPEHLVRVLHGTAAAPIRAVGGGHRG